MKSCIERLGAWVYFSMISHLFRPFATIKDAVRFFTSKSQRPEFNPRMDHKSFTTLPHTDIYILDSSLAIAYLKNNIPGWKTWADTHIALGKKFLLLEQTVEELKAINRILPKGFEPLKVLLFHVAGTRKLSKA